MRYALLMVSAALLAVGGCGREPGSTSLTKGSVVVQCDEAVAPVLQVETDQFRQQYADANVTLQTVDAREAVSNFAADSAQVIVTARRLNKEETDALGTTKIQYQEYKVALAAVAVIVHPDNPVKELRVSQLDSMYAGAVTRWPGRGGVVDLVTAGMNSSTNEVFRELVMGGKPFAQSATAMASSKSLISYVASHPAAIGLVNTNWLSGDDKSVTPLALARTVTPGDTSKSAGKFYSPAQAYVYEGDYPIVTPVYMYTREVTPGVGLGFISFITSPPGQKVFLNNGLVPVTQPVRLVKLTSQQVK